MTTALCITAGPEQVASIRKARQLGLRVVAIDRDPAAPGLREADAGYVIDPGVEDAVVGLARKEGARLVLPVPIGSLLRTVGAVNDALGLRGVTRHAAVTCTDKLVFRERLAELGVQNIQYRLAMSRDEIFQALETFPLPCVLKPRFGSGSRGVVVVDDRSRVPELVDEHVQLVGVAQHTLIEELVEGQELGVDAAAVDGRVTVTALRAKTVTPLPYRQEIGYHGPAPLSSQQLQGLYNVLESAVRAVGCDNCLLNFDVVLAADGTPYIIEMAPRPAGQLMAEVMVPSMVGVDLLAEGIRLLLGERADFSPKYEVPVALHFLRFQPGLVKHVPDLDWVLNTDGILAFRCNVKPGDRLRKITCGADVVARGYVMATGSTIAQALARADEVMRRVCAATEVIADDRRRR